MPSISHFIFTILVWRLQTEVGEVWVWSSKTVQLLWKTTRQYMPRAVKMFTFFGQRIPLQGDYPTGRVTNADGAFVHKDVHCSRVYLSKKLGIT